MSVNPMNSEYGDSIFPSVSATLRTLFITATMLLLVLSMVIPNSAQNATAATMVLCFVLALPHTKLNGQLLALGFLYLCSTIVTSSYLLVGYLNGAPMAAVKQIPITYMVSPLLWVLVLAGFVQTVGLERLIRWLGILAFASCLSVALFFYLFLNFGPAAVSFFKENANVNLTDGYAGAIMFVYGSMMFFCGAFFAAPQLIRNLAWRVLLLVALTLAAVTSGRSALMLSIPVGLLVGFLLPSDNQKGRSPRKIGKSVFICAVVLVALCLLSKMGGVDIFHIVDLFITELLSGGGSVRSQQMASLLEGSAASFGLGSGHGVGVSYIRSYDFPWRYETVLIATIFRVGLIGSLIYLLPFAWYCVSIFNLARKGQLPLAHKFMFAGFLCVFIAANTNPYIESFVFQWMYVMPLASLFAFPQDGEVQGTTGRCSS